MTHSEKPLAIYVSSVRKEVQNQFLESTSSGGIVVNETMMHLAGLANYFAMSAFECSMMLCCMSYDTIYIKYVTICRLCICHAHHINHKLLVIFEKKNKMHCSCFILIPFSFLFIISNILQNHNPNRLIHSLTLFSLIELLY